MKKLVMAVLVGLLAFAFAGCFETTKDQKVKTIVIAATGAASIDTNGSVSFSAVVKDEDGKEMAGQTPTYYYLEGTTWKTIGTTATFKPSTCTPVLGAGTYKVKAKIGDIESNQVDIIVSAGTTTVPVTGVTVTSTATAIVGGTVTLSAVIAPTNATNQNVTWTSADATVATVTNGVVTGIKAGTVNITVTTTDGNKTAVCTVTITAATVNPQLRFTNPDYINTSGTHYITRPHVKLYFKPVGGTLQTTITYEEDLSTATAATTTAYKSIPAGNYQVTYESINSAGVTSSERIAIPAGGVSGDLFSFAVNKKYTLKYTTQGDVTTANIEVVID